MATVRTLSPALFATCLLLLLPAASAEGPASLTIGERQWALATNGEDLPWAEADAHCEALQLEDREDWRLPSLEELQALHDPTTEGGAPAPIEVDTCCLWSSTTLADLPAEAGGDTAGPPGQYYWGLLFDTGTAYYSFQRFADGRALCVRDTDARGQGHQ